MAFTPHEREVLLTLNLKHREVRHLLAGFLIASGMVHRVKRDELISVLNMFARTISDNLDQAADVYDKGFRSRNTP